MITLGSTPIEKVIGGNLKMKESKKIFSNLFLTSHQNFQIMIFAQQIYFYLFPTSRNVHVTIDA